MKRLSLRGLLGLGVLLIVLLAAGKWAYDDWPLWSNTKADPRAFQFLKNVRKVARHGDLTDVKYIEETLGVKLELRRVASVDRRKFPNAKWEKAFFFEVLASRFPVRRPLSETGVPPDAGSYSYDESKEEQSADLLLNINYREACLSEEDITAVFGNRWLSKSISDGAPYKEKEFAFAGKNVSKVNTLFDTETRCLSRISISQND